MGPVTTDGCACYKNKLSEIGPFSNIKSMEKSMNSKYPQFEDTKHICIKTKVTQPNASENQFGHQWVQNSKDSQRETDFQQQDSGKLQIPDSVKKCSDGGKTSTPLTMDEISMESHLIGSTPLFPTAVMENVLDHLPEFTIRGLRVKDCMNFFSSFKAKQQRVQCDSFFLRLGRRASLKDLGNDVCDSRPIRSAASGSCDSSDTRLSSIRPSPFASTTIILFTLLATLTLGPTGSSAQAVSLAGVNASLPYSTSVHQATPTNSQKATPTKSHIDTLHLAVLMPEDEKQEINIKLVHPVIHIACDKVKSSGILSNVRNITIVNRDSRSSDVDGPLEAMALVKQGKVNAFFGPIVPNALSATALYCTDWNLPIFTSKGEITAFGDKAKEYRTLVRMMGHYGKSSSAVEKLLEYFNIKMAGMILDTPKRAHEAVSECYDIVHPVFERVKAITGKNQEDVYRGVFDGRFPMERHNFTKLLEDAKLKCRIIVLCASQDSVREIMIKAHELEFDNGEYVFFNIDLFSSHNATLKPWYRANDTDARNSAARKAYESLMTVTLRQPTSPQYKQFSKDVKAKAAQIYPNFTYGDEEMSFKDIPLVRSINSKFSKYVKAKAAQIYPNFTYGDEEVNSFVGAFYDAVLLYATALNETIDAGGNVTDGINITRRMWNRTFDGITGKVSIDENGDRNADYSLLDMDPKTGEFQVVADYYGTSKTYNEIQKIHWPGGRDGPPPDTPKCGFDGSKCPAKKPFPAYIIVIIVLGSVLIVVCIVGAFVYRHVKLEAELSEMNWRVKWDDIMFGGPTRNDKKSEKQNSQRISYSSDCSADTIAVHLSDVANKQLYTKTGYYKGAILAIKPIPRTHISMTKPLLMDIKKMKDLQNDHLVRFHGVCIDVPNQCILTEYCPKGSLQDVLENDEIKLDWMFRYSIMQDIVRGMTYLHSTDIKSHGHLKSSNCVVDSRFVVKITDFGLHYFKEKEEELEDDTYAIARSKLWTAPELLRLTNPPSCGTHKADVYSFAIICQEIVYRNGAFYLQNLDLQPSEITDKVRKGMKPLFRPTLEEFDCPSDELAGVIRRCWAEEPAERPDFQGLRTLIKKLNKDGDKGDILDNLLTRMEQYANNLEALVEERTADYLQEKKKAEELLYNMLPRSVAIQLIRGEVIKAEWFDSVTIYFSDICGFTALSAESTPMQVVDLLNDLYTVFDSIIDNFDVYKVETIGDAYMVVSGLPVKNGSLHAREIARMSLALLDAVFRFKIRHRPNDQLKLRIGIHSGPVCAGVVGLKMPRYCLFGDTVNTSSRMESNGLPLRIHVSPFTQEILLTFGTFHLEMRGPVEMKGKGTVITHWLLGEDNSPYNIQQQGMNQPTAPVTTSIATVTPTTSTSVTTSSVSPTSPEAKSSRKLSLKSLIH